VSRKEERALEREERFSERGTRRVRDERRSKAGVGKGRKILS
jgi:hypothetical protein